MFTEGRRDDADSASMSLPPAATALAPVGQPPEAAQPPQEDDFSTGALVLVGEKRGRPALLDKLIAEAHAEKVAKLARAGTAGWAARTPVPAKKARAGPGRPAEWVLRPGAELLSEEEFSLLSTEGLRQLWAEYYIHGSGLEAPRPSKSGNRAYLKRKLVVGGTAAGGV
jgi:hypothetical protein